MQTLEQIFSTKLSFRARMLLALIAALEYRNNTKQVPLELIKPKALELWSYPMYVSDLGDIQAAGFIQIADQKVTLNRPALLEANPFLALAHSASKRGSKPTSAVLPFLKWFDAVYANVALKKRVRASQDYVIVRQLLRTYSPEALFDAIDPFFRSAPAVRRELPDFLNWCKRHVAKTEVCWCGRKTRHSH